MTHQFLIASYQKDFRWLRPCLFSLQKFSRDFLPPVVCTDSNDAAEAKRICSQVFPEATVSIKDGRRGQGFMRAQIAMMSGDIHCPQADVTWLLGSDCVAYKEFSPEMYCLHGKPVLLWNTYIEIASPWNIGTNRVLGFDCPWETMRRLPLGYPRELFPRVRAHVESVAKQPFEDFIYHFHNGGNNVSESNIMGGYAMKFCPELYTLLHASPDCAEYVKYRTPDSDAIAQFWSHGGFDRPAETSVNYAPGKNTAGQTPRQSITDMLGPIL